MRPCPAPNSKTGARRGEHLYILSGRGGFAFFENVIVNRVHGPEGFRRDLGIRDADAKSLLHADHELKGIDGIETKATGSEKGEVIADLIRRRLKHQIFHQHFLDLGAEIGLGHRVWLAQRRGNVLPRESRLCRNAGQSQLMRALDLTGVVAGDARLVGIPPKVACGRGGRGVFNPRNGGGGCAGVPLGHIGLAGGMKLVGEFVLGLLEFLDGRTHAAGQLRQFFRAKQNENDQEDDDEVRSPQIHDAGQEAHR